MNTSAKYYQNRFVYVKAVMSDISVVFWNTYTSASVLWHCWLGGKKGIRPVKTEWWDVGMVIRQQLGAYLHMAQLMPLPLTVSCFSKIQIGFAFLVPAHLGSPGKRAVKRVCVIHQLRSSQLFLGQLPTLPQKFEKLIRAFINPAHSLKERQTNSCYLHALRRQRAEIPRNQCA